MQEVKIGKIIEYERVGSHYLYKGVVVSVLEAKVNVMTFHRRSSRDCDAHISLVPLEKIKQVHDTDLMWWGEDGTEDFLLIP